ncbi:hypothetical protein ES708_19701 [subsurface metagenome]
MEIEEKSIACKIYEFDYDLPGGLGESFFNLFCLIQGAFY